ncbi:MAG TPA: thiamine phosphate synthase [Hyphomicrobiales bacterium]|nr:thiamine phosphate synthase [Hyphomicrobiales bacterium]
MTEAEPRLYLLLPPEFVPAELAPGLAEVLVMNEVASVLLWLSTEDDRFWTQAAEILLPVCHASGVPLLLGGDANRAARLGADGVHLEAEAAALSAARKAHAPGLIIGAGGIASRHQAMLAAESGADYVLFGAADPARDRPVAATAILNLTEWWSELFQVPCVAQADSLDEAQALIQAGADFIAAGGLVWADAAGPAAAVRALADALHSPVAAS